MENTTLDDITWTIDFVGSDTVPTWALGRNAISSLSYYEYVGRQMVIFIYPAICGFGLLGNSATLYVMSREKMRKLSISVYLSALAVGDSMVLIYSLLKRWLEAFSPATAEQIYDLYDVPCKFAHVLRRIFYVFTGWVLVCVSAERLLVIALPLLATGISKVRNARAIVIILAIVAIVYGFAEVFAFGATLGACDLRKYYLYNVQQGGRWSLTTLYSYIPTCLIFTFSSLTAILLARRRQKSSAMTSSMSADKATVKATRIVMTVAVTYLVLTLPATVFVPYSQNGRRYKGTESGAPVIFLEICFIGILLNHSLNFVLYTLVSDNFRKELTKVCLGLRLRKNARQDRIPDNSSNMDTGVTREMSGPSPSTSTVGVNEAARKSSDL